MHKLFTENDIQLTLANYLRDLRKQAKLSRDALATRSTVPSSTIKKFELTGHISLRQFLLLWQSLDDLTRIHQLTVNYGDKHALPTSIDEILKDEF
ncbi:helix-turn-helix domain-containing protein [Paraglaciecola aquimarina]|uniref:Helix-turn-helix domain-containing protein n=1 Tax=Paraglaciecola algarum TaxID=3050085 RepID=A0ABS9DCS2_9ALTE|nr:helix-turn-helix transcriptional regulator [Paraglaciecola sp. G1-23]MCF2949436.1 helix-turn-helix domain-containing protein [Paraglaciecola sp. G1-23]